MNNPADLVPDLVPTSSFLGHRAHPKLTSSPVPVSTIRDEVSEPAHPRPRPRPNHTWTYPDEQHPSTVENPRRRQARQVECPHCGAPPRAHCVTRTNNILDGVHKARARAARQNPTHESTTEGATHE